MDRDVLRDEQWEHIAPTLPSKVGDPGRLDSDNRLIMKAVFYNVRTGGLTTYQFHVFQRGGSGRRACMSLAMRLSPLVNQDILERATLAG